MAYNGAVIKFKYELLNEADQEASIDAMTSLRSMVYFRNTLQNLLDTNRESLAGKAILYFNIDNFNAFNEKYGYESGDAFLIQLANILKKEFNGCLIARFSEDHFVVLSEASTVSQKLETIQKNVNSMPNGQNVDLKAGIYIISPDDTNASATYDKARLACNSIKNRYDINSQYYNFSLSHKIHKQKYIIDHIEEAIANEYIKVYYQPIVRVLTGKICGVEALSRWQDKEYGYISPEEFISVLEECHLIHKLDIYIIEKVCQDFSFLQMNKLNFVPPSINLSRVDFQMCDIFNIVDGIVSKYKINKSLFHIEITESALVKDTTNLKDSIQKFKDKGYQVWMDDFGSGYSSLNTLKDFDFDVLKIDMKFLSSFSKNPKSHIIISSIIDLAKKLGIQTLTEGVETEEELEFLKAVGCEKAQGFLFSRALDFENYCNLLLGRESLDDMHYQNEIGRTNFLSQNPLADNTLNEDNSTAPYSTPLVPISIIECKAGKLGYLSMTKSFLKVLESLGLNQEMASTLMNDREESIHTKFQILMTKCSKTRKREILDFIHNGQHCNIQVKLISVNKSNNAKAFAVILQNLTQFSKHHRSSNADLISNTIFSHYNRIDLINEDGNFTEQLYLTSSQYDNSAEFNKVRQNLEHYAQQVVHADDRQRFLDFYNFDKIWKELKKKSHLSNFFRTKNANNTYDWQLYILIPTVLNNKKMLLSCSRNIDMEQMEGIMKAIKES